MMFSRDSSKKNVKEISRRENTHHKAFNMLITLKKLTYVTKLT